MGLQYRAAFKELNFFITILWIYNNLNNMVSGF